MSLKHYCGVGSGVEVCLYLSIAGPAFPCRAPREKIEGDDGTGRGGSPTLRCYQEQEGEDQEEEETEYEKEEKELEEKMVSHIRMLSGVHCPLPPSRGGQIGEESKQ